MKIEKKLKEIKIKHPHKIEWKESRQIQKDLRKSLENEIDKISWKEEKLLNTKYKDKVDILRNY